MFIFKRKRFKSMKIMHIIFYEVKTNTFLNQYLVELQCNLGIKSENTILNSKNSLSLLKM